MALCRLSDYQCDLYIYETAEGIVCNVATRHLENEPEPLSFCELIEGRMTAAEFTAAYNARSDVIDSLPLIDIDLPHAGQFRTFSAWGELLEYVTELKALGHRVPDWVVESIEEEIKAEGIQLTAPSPWTRRQLQSALRAAGWTRMSGPAAIYQSPTDRNVHFHLDRVTAGRGSAWQHYAARRELPSTTRPEFQEA